MLPPDVTIVKQTQDATFDQITGVSSPYIRVTFTVGKHGPFVEKFPRDTFTADMRDQRLTQLANEFRT